MLLMFLNNLKNLKHRLYLSNLKNPKLLIFPNNLRNLMDLNNH